MIETNLMERNLVIIGGGPGGYVAAIRAAQVGIRATIIEKDKIGGTCLNRGCIPTKAMYKNAEVLNSLSGMNKFGIQLSGYSFDMTSVQERKNNIVNQIRTGTEQLIKANKIEVIKGEARFINKNILEVVQPEGAAVTIKAENIIIATGSVSPNMTEPGMDSPKVISSDEALNLDYVPKKMVIYGGGVIGVEFASIFASFGTEVTIIKYRPRLIRSLDEEVSKRLSVFFKRKKIGFDIGVKVNEVVEVRDGLKIITETEKGVKEYLCDLLLVATGRTPNIAGLNLESAGVEYNNKGIIVNSNYQTTAKGVYAIGDVIGGQMLAHVASEEGKVCVENIYGIKSSIDYDAIPSCVFSFPEVAVVGLTEEAAKERGLDYIVGKAVFAGNGKAMTLEETDGFIKVIAERVTHKLFGVHIIGPHASDLIHEAALAISHGMSIKQIGETVHAHPTLAEAFWEAVMSAKGEAIHILPKKK
ncbi:MAG: dihydrolipoyl dehydrogenase [Anaerovoracaceae bacterium]|jgi:dihydrolipoamide dehydrogenase|nr:dihydrolipoyl dehydrogenase [Clostridiales bacterium]